MLMHLLVSTNSVIRLQLLMYALLLILLISLISLILYLITLQVFNHFGFTESNLVEKAKRALKFFTGREVLSLIVNPIEDEI
jgi:hypothetical protein